MKTFTLVLLAVAVVAVPAHAITDGNLVKNLTFDTATTAAADGTFQHGSGGSNATVGAGSGIYGAQGNGSLVLDNYRQAFTFPVSGVPTTGTESMWFNLSTDPNKSPAYIGLWDSHITGQNPFSATGLQHGAYLGPSGAAGSFYARNFAGFTFESVPPSFGNLGLRGATHLLTISYGLTSNGTSSANVYVDGSLVSSAKASDTIDSSQLARMSQIDQMGFGIDAGAGSQWDFSNGSFSSGIGWLDDFGIWNTQLTANQAAALYSLGNSGVGGTKYGALDATKLFSAYDAGVALTGGTTTTTDGKQWSYVANIAGSSTTVGSVGSNYVVLDGSHGGMQLVPEPGTISLLVAAALSMLVFVWKKRK